MAGSLPRLQNDFAFPYMRETHKAVQSEGDRLLSVLVAHSITLLPVTVEPEKVIVSNGPR
jgi:hypothetical protein